MNIMGYVIAAAMFFILLVMLIGQNQLINEQKASIDQLTQAVHQLQEKSVVPTEAPAEPVAQEQPVAKPIVIYERPARKAIKQARHIVTVSKQKTRKVSNCRALLAQQDAMIETLTTTAANSREIYEAQSVEVEKAKAQIDIQKTTIQLLERSIQVMEDEREQQKTLKAKPLWQQD